MCYKILRTKIKHGAYVILNYNMIDFLIFLILERVNYKKSLDLQKLR